MRCVECGSVGNWLRLMNDFTDKTVFDGTYAMIVEFTKTVIDCVNPQTIILVQRKGRRIFNDIFDHYPKFIEGRDVVLDTSVRQRHLHDKRILILDDSVKSGKAIIDAVTLVRSLDDAVNNNIHLATLLANDDARSRIYSKTKVNITYMKNFETYEQQNNYYIDTIEYVIAGISTKYGTGYVVCEINLNGDYDIEYLRDIAKSVTMDIFNDLPPEYEYNDGYRDDCFLDIRIPIISDQSYGNGNNKIRFSFVRLDKSKIKVTYESMINPSDVKNCDKNAIKFRFCECNCYQGFEKTRLEDEVCIHCRVFNLSFLYSRRIHDALVKKFKSDGVTIKNAMYYPPSEFRHPVEIEHFLAEYQNQQ